MKKLLAATISTLVFTGCTTFETVSHQSPEAREILAFNSPHGGAALYLYRDRNSDYGGFEMILDINEEEISLAGSCLKRVELAPGTYHLNANHPDILGGEQKLDITLKQGDVQVIEFKPISRPIIPGESKLIPRTIGELKNLATTQSLCVLSTSRF